MRLSTGGVDWGSSGGRGGVDVTKSASSCSNIGFVNSHHLN